MSAYAFKTYFERKSCFDEITQLLEQYQADEELKKTLTLLEELKNENLVLENEAQKKLLAEKISALRTQLEHTLEKETHFRFPKETYDRIYKSLTILSKNFPRNDFDSETDLPLDPVSFETLAFNSTRNVATSDGYQFDIGTLLQSLNRRPNVNPVTIKPFSARDRQLINEVACHPDNHLPPPFWIEIEEEREERPVYHYRPIHQPRLIPPPIPQPQYRRPHPGPQEAVMVRRNFSEEVLPYLNMFLQVAFTMTQVVFTIMKIAVDIFNAIAAEEVRRQQALNLNHPANNRNNHVDILQHLGRELPHDIQHRPDPVILGGERYSPLRAQGLLYARFFNTHAALYNGAELNNIDNNQPRRAIGMEV